MTTDDLAGLLYRHQMFDGLNFDHCECGERIGTEWEDMAAHQAAVIAAAGWVKGREEWGTRDRNGHVRSHFFKTNAEEWAEIDHREVVRRIVTDWEPVHEAAHRG